MQLSIKKVNTNNKFFCLRVQSYIKSYYDNRTVECIRREVKSLQCNGLTVAEACKRWVEGGCLACYYSDVAKDLGELFGYSSDEVWTYFNNNEIRLWNYYVKLMVRELLHIVNKERCYIE